MGLLHPRAMELSENYTVKGGGDVMCFIVSSHISVKRFLTSGSNIAMSTWNCSMLFLLSVVFNL